MKTTGINMKKSLKYILILSLSFCSVSVFNSCDKEGDINIFSIEDDKELGRKVNEQIASEPQTYPVLSESSYPEAYQHLRRIRDTLLNSGKVRYKDEFLWEMKIIHNDSVLNAFCTPGGYIYVYTGLIKFLEAEDQFAGVLGHEMAHADRRHSTDQLTKAYGISTLLDIVLGKNQGMLSQIATQLLFLEYSRDNETEADLQSVVYLYPTRYDARGAARFFEKMIAEQQSNNPPEFLSTHPNPENRVEDIFNKWEELGGKEGGTFPDTYAQFKASLP